MPARARVRDAAEVRKAGEIKSYAKDGRRIMAPTRAFVEVEHWNEDLDGKLEPTQIVEYKGMRGAWRTHGRQGVHVEETFSELGWEESHLEADD